MDEILTKHNCIYWMAIAIAVIIEHLILGERWRHNELARRVVGVATVTLGMLPLLIWGELDFTTWVVQFVGFGISGFIVFLFYTWRAESERRRRIERKRADLDDKLWGLTIGGTAARETDEQGDSAV